MKHYLLAPLRYLLLLTLGVAPLFCSAQATPGVEIDKGLDQCLEQANSTGATVECIVSASQAWDDELNRQYMLLIDGQSEPFRQQMRQAQRAWVSYRDNYNQAISAYYQQQDGTIWRIVAAQSRMNVIRDKALDLYRLRTSTNLEGDAP